jgi:hypothetical protein
MEPEEFPNGTALTDRVAIVHPGGHVGNLGSVVADTPSYVMGHGLFYSSFPDAAANWGSSVFPKANSTWNKMRQPASISRYGVLQDPHRYSIE